MGETLEYRAGDISRRDFLRTATGAAAAGVAYATGIPVHAQDGTKTDLSQYFQREKRLAVPSPADVTGAIKFVKEILKEEYAKANRDLAAKQELASLLLKNAQTEEHDLGSFAMFRESRDKSAEVKAFDTTYDAITGMFDKYDITMSKSMNGVVKRVRGPSRDDIASLVDMHIRLAEHAINANDYDGALSAAKYASSKARYAGKEVSERAKKLVSHIPKLKAEYELALPPKSELALSTNPGDSKINHAIGSYLCFVKGEWDVGAEFLAKSDYRGLEKVMGWELKKPADTQSRYSLGEDWADLAKKARKGSIERERFTGRARSWLEAALTDAKGLIRTHIEKRLTSLEPATAGGIGLDLLRMIDPKRDNASGEWSRNGQLISTSRTTGCLKIPYTPPEEYDITMIVKPKDGIDSVVFGLMKGNINFVAWIDNILQPNRYTGIQMVDGNAMTANKTTYKGKVLKANKTSTIIYSVRKNSVSITVDGEVKSKYEKSHGPLGSIKVLAPASYTGLYVAVFDTAMDIKKLTLTPISGGRGKKSR